MAGSFFLYVRPFFGIAETAAEKIFGGKRVTAIKKLRSDSTAERFFLVLPCFQQVPKESALFAAKPE